MFGHFFEECGLISRSTSIFAKGTPRPTENIARSCKIKGPKGNGTQQVQRQRKEAGDDLKNDRWIKWKWKRRQHWKDLNGFQIQLICSHLGRTACFPSVFVGLNCPLDRNGHMQEMADKAAAEEARVWNQRCSWWFCNWDNDVVLWSPWALRVRGRHSVYKTIGWCSKTRRCGKCCKKSNKIDIRDPLTRAC